MMMMRLMLPPYSIYNYYNYTAAGEMALLLTE
jgi:hypothetical protein